jgi:hypothetical protein
MHHSALAFAWYYFWIVPHLLLFVIAAVMLRRGLHRQFPWFFTYLVSEGMFSIIAFVLTHIPSISEKEYGVFAIVQMIANVGVRFGIVYELFSKLFVQYPALVSLGRTALRWTIIVLLLLAVGLAGREPAGIQQRISFVATILDRSVSLVQCGLVLLLFVFSSYFRLSWQNFVMGIAIGLGIFASVELSVAAVFAEIAPVTRNVQYIFDFAAMGTYHVCVLIWLGYLLAPERVRQAAPLPANDLKSWDRELQRLLQQ